MSERTCEGCRWFRFDVEWEGKRHGFCRKSPPVAGDFSATFGNDMCGEWADKDITPEQAERRELIRQFAVAVVASGSEAMVHQVWQRAAELADYEGQT